MSMGYYVGVRKLALILQNGIRFSRETAATTRALTIHALRSVDWIGGVYADFVYDGKYQTL